MFGSPEKLQSDLGSDFNNLLLRAILEAANVGDEKKSQTF
jgi:hypothetical protein